MDKNKILEKLIDFEQNGRLKELNFNGINVWPLIRSELQFKIIKGDEYIVQQEELTWPSKNVISSFKAKLKLRSLYKQIKHQIDQKSFQNIDVLFYSDDNLYYTDLIHGKHYHRHIDPFLEEYSKLDYKATKFHFLTNEELSNKYHSSDVFEINKEVNEFIWYNTFLNYSDQNYTSLIEICKEFEINSNSVITRLHKVLSLKKIAKYILKIYSPKSVGLTCFYCEGSYAFSLASKELGIHSFDIQHGKQGESHFCYTHYTLQPKEGYHLMPDYFWNWGEDSVKNINKKFEPEESPFSCIVGGNLWMYKWKNTSFYQLDKEEDEFVNKLKTFNKRVLVTTQPVGNEPIPDFVKQLIKMRTDVFWGIRLHPAQKGLINELKSEYASFQNVEVELSTNMPLYLVLKEFDSLLTKWSSVGLEALFFDLKTILLDEYGVKSFQKYVEDGLMDVALTSQELELSIDSIQENKDHDSYLQKSICLDPKLIQTSLRKIVE